MRSRLTPSRGSPSSSNLSINGTNALAGALHIQGSDSFMPVQADNNSVSLPNPTIAITPPPTSNPPQRQPQQGSRGGTLPTAICAYYLNSIKGVGQGCLRVNCKFFHGTEEQLADLRKRHKRLKSPNGSNASTRSGSTVKSAEGEARPQKEREPLQRLKLVKDNELGNKRPIVCLNYLTDTCHRPGCRFLHLPANVRPLPMTVCDYFSTGTCTRKRCRFFHGSQEVLSRMHAQGVTMYNPITNEPHDPATSLEELMKLQERTTVPLSAASPTPPPQQAQAPQPSQTVCIINGQMPPPNQPYTIQYLTTTNNFAPPARHVDPHAVYGMPQQAPMHQMMMPYHQAQYQAPPPTTIVIRQGPPAGAGYPQQPMYAPHQGQHHHTIPESVLNAIMQQHPGATIIAAPAPPPMPNHSLPYQPFATQLQPASPFPSAMGMKGPQWGIYE